jgi:hypothetical protein
MLLAKIDNPLNRMIIEDRKRRKYGKATGILSLVLGADVWALAIISTSAIRGLDILSNGLVSGNTFVALDLVGAGFAILTGFLLLTFRHFSKISFSIACGVGIFFGLTLPLIDLAHVSGDVLSVVVIGGVVTVVVSAVVMFLSIFSA